MGLQVVRAVDHGRQFTSFSSSSRPFQVNPDPSSLLSLTTPPHRHWFTIFMLRLLPFALSFIATDTSYPAPCHSVACLFFIPPRTLTRIHTHTLTHTTGERRKLHHHHPHLLPSSSSLTDPWPRAARICTSNTHTRTHISSWRPVPLSSRARSTSPLPCRRSRRSSALKAQSSPTARMKRMRKKAACVLLRRVL